MAASKRTYVTKGSWNMERCVLRVNIKHINGINVGVWIVISASKLTPTIRMTKSRGIRTLRKSEYTIIKYAQQNWYYATAPNDVKTQELLVNREHFVTWLQPVKSDKIEDQIAAILWEADGNLYPVSLRMAKLIWRHVRCNVGFKNEEDYLGTRMLKIPMPLLVEKIRVRERFCRVREERKVIDFRHPKPTGMAVLRDSIKMLLQMGENVAEQAPKTIFTRTVDEAFETALLNMYETSPGSLADRREFLLKASKAFDMYSASRMVQGVCS